MIVENEGRDGYVSANSMAIHDTDCSRVKKLKDPIRVVVRLNTTDGNLRVVNHCDVAGEIVWPVGCCERRFRRVIETVFAWGNE